MTNYLHNLKFIIAAAAIGAAGTAVAETATATWTFTADGVVATAAEELGTEMGLTIGDKLTDKGYDANLVATKYNVNFKGNTAGQRWPGSEFAFAITPAVEFSINQVNVDLMNSGWGDGRFDLELVYGETTINICKTETPNRDNGDTSLEGRTKSYKLSEAVTVSAGTTCTVTLHYYARNAQESRNLYIGSLQLVGAGNDEGDIPPTPEYTGVEAPLAPGTFFDLTKDATSANASFQGDSNNPYVGNTGSQTWVKYPFYSLTGGDLMFYFAGSSSGVDARIALYLDGEQEENLVGIANIEDTGSWTNFQTITLAPLGNLEAGQHYVVAKVLETSDRYAGNWRVAIYDAAPFTSSFNGAHGIYTGGARSENNGENVGNIKNNATATHHLYVDQENNYEIQMAVRYYGEGVCHITIPEDNVAVDYAITNTEAAAAPERALGSAYKPATIELGNLTKGTKTLNMTFNADHTGYIANYGDLRLVAVDNGQTGIESIEAAEDCLTVEYYNLQGVRVADSARGILIRVATDAAGVRTTTKVVR